MYPSDANGTIPGAGEGARCTAASIAARKLTFVTDLWLAEGSYEGPAVGLNATMGGSGFEEALFTERAVGLIHNHTSSAPFFLYYAMHLLHSPLCAPPDHLDRFAFIENEDRRYVAAMVAFMDESVGKVVGALKAANMWANTLFVWSSDNGAAIELTTGAKSAYPLKGGYYTNWEGGVRAPGLVAGGFVPAAARGTTAAGLMHLCDFVATFCAVGGCDPTDASAAAAGLPPVDSLDLWPHVSGQNASSPRTEVWLTPLSGDRYNGTQGRSGDAAIIVGRHKLIVGDIGQSSWTGPVYPNASRWPTWATIENCTTPQKVGCLFDIFDDPTEHHDLAAAKPDVAAALLARLEALEATKFDPPRGKPDAKSCDTLWDNGGYWGPWLK